jgi:hypothetical protein
MARRTSTQPGLFDPAPPPIRLPPPRRADIVALLGNLLGEATAPPPAAAAPNATASEGAGNDQDHA